MYEKKEREIKKAFDTVARKIVLSKFDFYGIRQVSREWAKSYILVKEIK